MAISVDCPDCGKKFRVSDALAGKKGRCKACGGTLVIPEPQEAPAKVDLFADLAGHDEPTYKTAGSFDEPPEVLPTRAPKPKVARRQGTPTGETDPVYKWGRGIIMFGMAGFLLPFVGLQFKGLGELPPEVLFWVFSIALVIGTGLLAGGKPASTLQRVGKYLWMTFMAVVMVIFILGVIGSMSGEPVPQPAPAPVANAPVQPKPGPVENASPPIVVPPASNPAMPPPRPAPLFAKPAAPIVPGPADVIEPFVSIGVCQAIRKPGSTKNEIDFRIDYEITGNIPGGMRFFSVVESGASKASIPVFRRVEQKGTVAWTATLTDGDTGPFQTFFATASYGPGGKKWVTVSNVVDGIPLKSK